MPGYLEEYGAGDERREKKIRWIVVTTLATALLGAVLYFGFRDWREEKRIDAFLGRLRQQDYQGAYAMWGCTDPSPKACRDYPYGKFLEDWGPKAPYAGLSAGRRSGGERCGTGYIGTVSAAGNEASLWVEHQNGSISFAPWRECPEMRFRLMKWIRMKLGRN